MWITIYPIMFNFNKRVSLIYLVIYFSVAGYYLYNHSDIIAKVSIKYYRFFITVALVMSLLFLYVSGRLYYYETIRFAQVQHSKKLDQQEIILKPIKFVGLRLLKFDDLSKDYKQYDNRNFATLYGVKKIRMIE